ncbi:sensor histidine kinase [Deinococcus sonorensis]|uniref:histidine kinase n=2 Tax=Deinococcus sonorensis TaxID=309891 RepID=A0AAU7U5W7_9DEIO
MSVLSPRPTIRFSVVVAVVALATVVPLVTPDPRVIVSPRGLLALVWIGVVLAALYGLQARPFPGPLLERGGLALLVVAGLTGLSFTYRGLETIPTLFALGTLGARLPARWVVWQSVPLVAYLVWLFSRGTVVQPISTLSNTLGLFGLLYLGFTINRQHALSLQLQQANLELERRAEQEGELSRLRERERLARDLHDTMGHALSTLTVQLEAAKRLATRAPERVPGQIEDAQALARQALRDLRSTLDDLRTGDAPLHTWLAERAGALARQHGWALQHDLQPVSVPPQTAEDVRRIAAEALENVARHAHATRVRLALQEVEGQLQFVVEDHGQGFDPADPPDGHYGVRGMRERAALLGGTLQLSSSPGGTRVALQVPLRVPQPQERTVK